MPIITDNLESLKNTLEISGDNWYVKLKEQLNYEIIKQLQHNNISAALKHIKGFQDRWISQVSSQIEVFRKEYQEEYKKSTLTEIEFKQNFKQKCSLSLSKAHKIFYYIHLVLAKSDKYKALCKNTTSTLFIYNKMKFLLEKIIEDNFKQFEEIFSCVLEKNFDEFNNFSFTDSSLGVLGIPILGDQNTAWGNAKVVMISIVTLTMRKMLAYNENKSIDELLNGGWSESVIAYPVRVTDAVFDKEIANEINQKIEELSKEDTSVSICKEVSSSIGDGNLTISQIGKDSIFMALNKLGCDTQFLLWICSDGFGYTGGVYDKPTDELSHRMLSCCIEDCGRFVSQHTAVDVLKQAGLFGIDDFDTHSYWHKTPTGISDFHSKLFDESYKRIENLSENFNPGNVVCFRGVKKLESDPEKIVLGGLNHSVIIVASYKNTMKGSVILVTLAASRDIQTQEQEAHFGPNGMSGMGLQIIELNSVATKQLVDIKSESTTSCEVKLMRGYEVLVSCFEPKNNHVLQAQIMQKERGELLLIFAKQQHEISELNSVEYLERGKITQEEIDGYSRICNLLNKTFKVRP